MIILVEIIFYFDPRCWPSGGFPFYRRVKSAIKTTNYYKISYTVFWNPALFCWYCRYTNGTPSVTLILLLEVVSQSFDLKCLLLGIFFRIPFRMSLFGVIVCFDAAVKCTRKAKNKNELNMSDMQHCWHNLKCVMVTYFIESALIRPFQLVALW